MVRQTDQGRLDATDNALERPPVSVLMRND